MHKFTVFVKTGGNGKVNLPPAKWHGGFVTHHFPVLANTAINAPRDRRCDLFLIKQLICRSANWELVELLGLLAGRRGALSRRSQSSGRGFRNRQNR